MKQNYKQFKLLLVICVMGIFPINLIAATYYVSNSGNDGNNGTSTSTPWKTLGKVSTTLFNPGDLILFNSGEVFSGQLIITSSGSTGAPIVYGKYGSGALPVIQGQGLYPSTVYSINKGYLELNDLKVTNYKAGNNINDENATRLRGAHFNNQDAGTINYIHLNRMEFTDINGEHASGTSRYYGGVHFEISGTTVPSKWNDILVSQCYFHHLSRTGLGWDSSWEVRSATSTFGQALTNGYVDNYVPSTGIQILDNRFEHISGNGFICRTASWGLAQGNYFNYCGEFISGNAAFCFNTDYFVFQYNESEHTVYNEGDTDARGFDSDFRCKNTIVQYNYLHDNGGGFVATGGPEDGTAYQRFNTGLVVRYNVMEDNEREGMVFSGNLYNATIHNNVVFSNSTLPNVEIVNFHDWMVYPHDVTFYNNVFWGKGTGCKYVYGDSRNITFRHNAFQFTTAPQGLPVAGYNSFAHIAEDTFPVLDNPMFDNPSSGGYRLQPGSPAFNVGIRGLAQPTIDYYNTTIGNTRNIGVDQTPGASTTVYKVDINDVGNGTVPSGWVGLVGTQDNELAINGVRFTMFGGIAGTSDRGTGGDVTRDFAHNSGTNSIIGVRLEYLPAGTYNVETYHYDSDYNGLVNVEFREVDNLPSTEVKVTGKSITSTAPASFQITVVDGKDYELVAREASTQDRTRFNGFTITPVTSGSFMMMGAGKPEIGSAHNMAAIENSKTTSEELTIYPNPVADDFTVSQKLTQDDQLTITVMDVRGKTVYSKVQAAKEGNWELHLNKDDLQLERGVYVVSVTSKNHKPVKGRILVL